MWGWGSGAGKWAWYRGAVRQICVTKWLYDRAVGWLDNFSRVTAGRLLRRYAVWGRGEGGVEARNGFQPLMFWSPFTSRRRSGLWYNSELLCLSLVKNRLRIVRALGRRLIRTYSCGQTYHVPWEGLRIGDGLRPLSSPHLPSITSRK